MRGQGKEDKEIIRKLGLKQKLPFKMDWGYLKPLYGFVTSRLSKNPGTQKGLEYEYSVSATRKIDRIFLSVP